MPMTPRAASAWRQYNTTGDPESGEYYPLKSQIREWAEEIEDSVGMTPEMFGAKGDGVTDDSSALAELASWQRTTGGKITLNAKEYGVLSPWVLNYSKVHVTGHGGLTHNDGTTVIKKLPGFSGAAAVVVAGGNYGIKIEGIYVDGGSFSPPDGPGTREAGDGFLIGASDVIVMRNCQAQHNAGWGFRFNSPWDTKLSDINCRWNGVPGGGGGGIYLEPESRSISQFYLSRGLINNNFNHQQLLGDGGSSALRTVGAKFWGIQYEAGSHVATDAVAILEIKSADRTNFTDCQFAQGADIIAPCILLGDDSVANEVKDVAFTGPFVQHNIAGPGYAVVTKNNVSRVTFAYPSGALTNSKFMNAAGTASPNASGDVPTIKVVGGDIDPTDYNNPNGAIITVGDYYTQVGPLPGTAGNDITVQSRLDERPVVVRAKDAAGDYRGVSIGAGAGSNVLDLDGVFQRLTSQDAAPAITGSSGKVVIVLANRADWDPLGKGSGGAYLVMSGDGGTTWQALDAQIPT